MIRYVLAMVLVLTTATGFAEERGKAVIIGNGEASASPEYLTLQVDVISLCYDTSLAAKDANAALANSLLEVLKTFATDPRSKVTAAGGSNIRQSETVNDGDHVKIICEMKWRATNRLKIKMPDIASLASLQDGLLAAVDQAAASRLNPEKTAQTYADLSQPSFHVYDETLVKLRAEAQDKALDDAKIQLKTFMARCAFEDVRLAAIKPPRVDVYYRASGQFSVPGATPIIPEEISVNASWQFEWSYYAPTGCLAPTS